MCADFDKGTIVADKLRIIRLLGEGGMGAVYEVEHLYTKHRRALKMLHTDLSLSQEVVARFLREASAAGRIGSPHIVETHDAGRLPTGEPYLVMDMLEGKPLDAIIARCGQLPIGYAVEAVCQACTGVQAAHDAGIVHRDLKPENLFLIDPGSGLPFVKILDFGISKFDPTRTGDQSLTQDGAQLGTPYYMSPEQILAQPVDGRTDVYSLGVVLYECLAGCRPFEADTLPQLSVLIHSGDCSPIEAHRTDIPPALAAIIRRAMSCNRDARYSTPAEMATALRGAIAEQPFERTLFVPRDSLPQGEGGTSVPPPGAGGSGGNPTASAQGGAVGAARDTTFTHVIAVTSPSADRPLSDLGSTTQAGAISTDRPAIEAAVQTQPRSARYLVAGVAGGAVLIIGGIAIGWSMSGGQAPKPATTPSANQEPAGTASAERAAPNPSVATSEQPAHPEPPVESTTPRSHGPSQPKPSTAVAHPRPEVTPAVGYEPTGAKPIVDAKPEPASAPTKPVSPPPPTRAEQDGLKGNPFAK